MSAAGDFRVLGALEARGADGHALRLGGPKPRALLAFLLLNANEPVAVDRIVDALWGERPPATAEHSIQVYVSTLRKAIGERTIVREEPGYRLSIEDDRLDARRFESLLHQGEEQLEEGRADRAAETLAEALRLWRGRAFADVAYEDFARVEAERLEELRLTAIETRLEAELMLGRRDGTVAELQALVSEHPLREHFRAQLMTALFRSGRQADALDVYRDTWRLFVDELGIEPSPQLRDLERAILRQDGSLRVPRALSAEIGLPKPASSLVGRGSELLELRDLLLRTEVRLVTLTGPGGIGKTRLSIEAVWTMAGEYPDGVALVELASHQDPELLEEAIAAGLGARSTAAEHVGSRRMLLVLDNLEHLLDAVSAVAELLRACPNLDVLATSRERLRLSGEHVFEVPPLEEVESIALFTERATAVKRGFDANGTVAAICQRLDGVPLAIELAAARVGSLDGARLLEVLDQRLPVLVDGPRDVPERQRTLQATIEWSHDLLSADERVLFARLAVFAGGCTLEAAEEVCDADRDTLQSLVEKSLLRHTGERFWMLETIRQYALERLVRSDFRHETRRFHARYFSIGASRWAPLLNEEHQAAAFAWFDLEIDNLRIVGAWFLEELLPDDYVGLTIEVYRYLWRRHLGEEGRVWLERSLAFPVVDISLRTQLLLDAAPGWLDMGDIARARLVLNEALELARETGSEEHLARAMFLRGHLAFEEGDFDAAEALITEASDSFDRLGDERGVAVAASSLGQARARGGDDRGALDLYAEALSFHRAISDTLGIAWLQALVASSAIRAGDDREAAAALEEAFSLYEVFGAAPGLLEALIAFGELAERRGSTVAIPAFTLCRSLDEKGLELGDERRRRLASLGLRLGGELSGRQDGAPETEPTEAARWARESLALLGV